MRSAKKRGSTGVCVHDLGLCVTVQLLEDTPAVPSLGKLCEEHGYSYEWVSGQKPRLTKKGKKYRSSYDFASTNVAGMTGISGDGLERATGANVNDGLGLVETNTVSRARMRTKSAMIAF